MISGRMLYMSDLRVMSWYIALSGVIVTDPDTRCPRKSSPRGRLRRLDGSYLERQMAPLSLFESRGGLIR